MIASAGFPPAVRHTDKPGGDPAEEHAGVFQTPFSIDGGDLQAGENVSQRLLVTGPELPRTGLGSPKRRALSSDGSLDGLRRLRQLTSVRLQIPFFPRKSLFVVISAERQDE